MNEFAQASTALLQDAGGFDPDCAECSWSLPSSWYRDPDVYRLERQHIFQRSWIYQCHQSELSQPGSAYLGAVDGEPVLIRHAGEALSASLQPGGERTLVEIYLGFVFVNLDLDATPLWQLCGSFIDDVQRCCPRIDELRPFRRIEREVAANWKTLIDNNHECYHCAANHPSLMKLVDYRKQAVWSDDGITFSHKVKHNRLDNPAYSLDPGSIEQDSLFGFIWPTLIPLWFPGSASAVLFQIVPLGPEHSIARHDFYFTGEQPTQQELKLIEYIDRELVPEDVALCESVQRGLRSRGYHQGRLIVNREQPDYSEHHVHWFQRMVYRALSPDSAKKPG